MQAQTSSPSAHFNARAQRARWPTTCDETLAFQNDRLPDLLAIWHSVRGDRALPKRADFTARSLGRHLQNLCFVERHTDAGGAPRYRFRLFGSGLSRYTGDWTGKFLDEMVAEPHLQNWTATYDTAIAASAPLRFVSRFHAEHLRHFSAETLIAPLADDRGNAAGLMISVAYTATVA